MVPNQTRINSNGELATLTYAAVAPNMDYVPKNDRARCPTCQLLVDLRLELSRDSLSPRIITNSSRSIRTVCRMGSVDVHMAVEDLVRMDLGQASRLNELKVGEEMDRLLDQLQEATDCGGHRSARANDVRSSN
jgi:hypothetical protein